MGIRPRFYLDVDGVLCPTGQPDPAWGVTKSAVIHMTSEPFAGDAVYSYPMIWAPTLLGALEALRLEFDLELVWLTTWNERNAIEDLLVPHFGSLHGGRTLPEDARSLRPRTVRGWWKAQRLADDQAQSAAPFIWIDDTEVEPYRRRVVDATAGTDRLFISPHPTVGLRPDHVLKMRTWLTHLTPPPPERTYQ